jgi:hypothetical protein
MRLSFAPLLLMLLMGPAAASFADEPGQAGIDKAGVEFFEKKIRPVLVEHCYACHSSGAKKKQGGLLLDSREAVRDGGDSGPVVVPGKPDESLLIKAISYTDENLKMPPKGKLPAAIAADLAAWVKMGAPQPPDKAVARATAVSWAEMLRNRRGWWSLQPVTKAAVPPVKDTAWSNHAVDRFLLAKLEERGLRPAGQAERHTLIRRLSLVLTGLPPTPEEVAAFVGDRDPNTVARLVDRLLASPHYGERWARHWMDVVRFTETHGNEWNYEVHHAWRYRDYLVRAFNEDVPYDQLVREHIAGDLLSPPRWNRVERFNESVIGTAFYRFGEVNHDDCIGLRQIGFDLADNQIDTLSKAFQATTVACARCHDHKIDAVSMQDYYGLLGVLRSSRQVSHVIDAPEVNAEPMRRLRALKTEIRRELGEVWLRQARDIGRYLLAAHARLEKRGDAAELGKGLDAKRLASWLAVLKVEKTADGTRSVPATLPLEDLLEPWRALTATKSASASGWSQQWRKIAERYAEENQNRTGVNPKQFVSFADFRAGGPANWQVGGQGLREGPARSGDFAISHEGETLVKSVLPAGCFTHTLSDKLNGTLRSPLLRGGKKYISLQVMGQRSSAVRLVSNNCQLNYKNYRALTSGDLHWVTFETPEDCDSLRVYAELMTMLDNPKFPDQLSALGGDKENYRLPWEKAAANPRSFFGLTRVVLHDTPEPPKPELSHFRPLFANVGWVESSRPTNSVSLADVAARYATVVEAAARAFAADRATDDDVRWLDGLLQRDLLSNRIDLTPRLQALAQQYRQTEAQLALPRIVPGLADVGPGFDQPAFVRGDCLKPSEVVPRRYLEVLSKPQDRFQSNGSGRLELAERIASADNPLTARVIVNRIWHHLFGTGLVRTVDDFGRVGELPSHPELLDYLASRFVEDGWSLKRLIRSLVLTRTFQMASKPSPLGKEIDPENRLLHHYPARRLEAEAIRDSILAASGRLDQTCYGMSVPSYREKENADRRLFSGPLDGNGRRSLYIKNTLMEPPRFLSAFDFPGGKVTQGRRDVTNVPAQALALLNDPFVLEQASVWAERLVARRDTSAAARIEHMFQVALGRPPVKDEQERFEQAASRLAELHRVPADEILKSRAVWKDLAHTMFNLKEFIYIP